MHTICLGPGALTTFLQEKTKKYIKTARGQPQAPDVMFPFTAPAGRRRLRRPQMQVLSRVAIIPCLLLVFLVQRLAHGTSEGQCDGLAAASVISQRRAPRLLGQPARAAAVKEAMQHAWAGYEQYAWGADELRPLSKSGKMGVSAGSNDGFHGLGASIIDAMSTLYVMGLDEEFHRAEAWVVEKLSFDLPNNTSMAVSFFEITIRVLGGLLSAFDLSGNPAFLAKAQDLGNRLLPAFEGTATGIVTNVAHLPWTTVSPARSGGGNVETLAEIGSNVLEFGTLSSRTSNTTYRKKAEAGMRFMHELHPHVPILGTYINRATGERLKGGSLTIAAPVDSYYEYLLKNWLLTNRTDEHWRRRWTDVVDTSLKILLLEPQRPLYGEHYAVVGELQGLALNPRITHLGCFWPGNIALGVHRGAALTPEKETLYLAFARGMAFACFQLYNATFSGLGAESALVDIHTGVVMPQPSAYHMRPEVVESLFYLWRATGEERYRDWGWTIFQAIQRWCRQEAGYSGVADVSKHQPTPTDSQESWFLAETLKYLYLLFSDDNVLDLSEWVFNTEAHPLRIAPLPGGGPDMMKGVVPS